MTTSNYDYMTVIEKQYMEAVISVSREMRREKGVDWEQRRYETARACLAAEMDNYNQRLKLRAYHADGIDSLDDLKRATVDKAVEMADLLVERLKKEAR